MKRESKAKQIRDSIDRFIDKLIQDGETYVDFGEVEYEIDGITYTPSGYLRYYTPYEDQVAYYHMRTKGAYVKNGNIGEEQINPNYGGNKKWFILK